MRMYKVILWLELCTTHSLVTETSYWPSYTALTTARLWSHLGFFLLDYWWNLIKKSQGGCFSSTSAFWWVRKGKGAIPYSHPNLSFSVIIFSLSGWLAQGSNLSKKGYAGVLGYLCFLEHCCFLSAFEAISGLNGKPGLFGLSVYVLT